MNTSSKRIAAHGRERLVALPADDGHQLQLDFVASGAKWLAIVLEGGSADEKFQYLLVG